MNKTPKVGRSLWGMDPNGEPPVQTGMGIAIFQNEKFQALYVSLDQTT